MSLNKPKAGYPTAADAELSEDDIYLYGNINLYDRFARSSPDDPQAVETLRSMSFQISIVDPSGLVRKCQVLVPTLDTDGYRLTDNQAKNLYFRTKNHLGIFFGVKRATRYAKVLSIFSGNIAKALKQQRLNPSGLSSLDFVTQPFNVFTLADIPESLKQSSIIQPKKLHELIAFSEIPPESLEFKTIAERLISIDVSYELGNSTEVTLRLIDFDYWMLNYNYFIPRRIIKYRGREYEVAVVESDIDNGSPVLSVILRPRIVQMMKRDKRSRSLSGSNGYSFAKIAAKEYGLGFAGEESPTKVQTIVTATTKDSDQSLWNTLQQTAQQGESLCFEMDGCLIYGSEKWLFKKFGLFGAENKKFVPVVYVPPSWLAKLPKNNSDIDNIVKSFPLLQWPSYRTSENDVMEAEGSCKVLKPNGCLIRPGMTALTGVWPDYFAGFYLITTVSFSEGENGPVDVAFRSITKPSSQSKIDLVGISPSKNSFYKDAALRQFLQQITLSPGSSAPVPQPKPAPRPPSLGRAMD